MTPPAVIAVRLQEVVTFLDGYLAISETPDEPNALNGLQVDAAREVRTVACAVDASEPIIEEACLHGADLLVVHHGLFWGGNRPLVGPHGRKLRRCFEDGLSVYAAHAPLDLHPEVGNNVLWARALGLEPDPQLARSLDLRVGVVAVCDFVADELTARVGEVVGQARRLGRGPERVRRLAIVAGAGGRTVEAAAGAGLDALLTGEASHPAAILAEELGLHLILGGHYRTERFGVQALGRLLEERLGLKQFFLEHDSGL